MRGRKTERPNPLEAAEADVQEYDSLSRGERTRRYKEFKVRLDGHCDAELRRTGSRGATWESQITGKFDRFYRRIAVAYEEVTGLPASPSPENPPGKEAPDAERMAEATLPSPQTSTNESKRLLARRSQLVRANNAGYFGKTYTVGEIGDFLATQDDVPRFVLLGPKRLHTKKPARRSQLWHANKRGFFGGVFTEQDLSQFDRD